MVFIEVPKNLSQSGGEVLRNARAEAEVRSLDYFDPLCILAGLLQSSTLMQIFASMGVDTVAARSMLAQSISDLLASEEEVRFKFRPRWTESFFRIAQEEAEALDRLVGARELLFAYCSYRFRDSLGLTRRHNLRAILGNDPEDVLMHINFSLRGWDGALTQEQDQALVDKVGGESLSRRLLFMHHPVETVRFLRHTHFFSGSEDICAVLEGSRTMLAGLEGIARRSLVDFHKQHGRCLNSIEAYDPEYGFDEDRSRHMKVCPYCRVHITSKI